MAAVDDMIVLAERASDTQNQVPSNTLLRLKPCKPAVGSILGVGHYLASLAAKFYRQQYIRDT